MPAQDERNSDERITEREVILEVLDKNEWREAKYALFAIETVSRKLDPPVRCKGREVHRHHAPRLIVCDTETGELFRVEGWHFGERLLQRESILASLRAGPRHFAYFLLAFRNYRRGTTPDLEQLVEWYAELYGLRPDNVRRYIDPLKKVGVIETSTLLGRLFQLSSKDMLASEYLGEEFGAWAAFTLMWAKRERLRELRAEYVGASVSPLMQLAA